MKTASLGLVALAILGIGCGPKDETTGSATPTAVKGTMETAPNTSTSPAVSESEKITEIDTSELGVKLYPGAFTTKVLGGVADQGHTITGHFQSTDPISKIGEFYKKEIKSSNPLTTGDSGFLMGKNAQGKDTTVTLAHDKDAGITAIIIEVKK
jgi:hypothetical protein